MANAGLSSAGQELMNIWNDLDRGAVKHEQAFEQADPGPPGREACQEYSDGEMVMPRRVMVIGRPSHGSRADGRESRTAAPAEIPVVPPPRLQNLRENR
jgi:hypothetical protein